MKSGKRHMTERMELPAQDLIRTLGEKETYKYLGRLEADTIKQNLINGINTWVVPFVRYSGPFLNWTRDDLKQMDQRTRKLMTTQQALHPRDDVDRLYV